MAIGASVASLIHHQRRDFIALGLDLACGHLTSALEVLYGGPVTLLYS
jgi:hypothetical protein